MHNITPHIHHGEISEALHNEMHHNADSPIDWLLLSFHQELGEDHLECFSEIETVDLQFLA